MGRARRPTSTLPETLVCRMIWAGIAGKYPQTQKAHIYGWVPKYLRAAERLGTLDEFERSTRPIGSARDDVRNQVLTMVAISRLSGEFLKQELPLITVHRLLYGESVGRTTRTAETVEGYDGRIPTRLSEAAARFAEVNTLLCALANMPGPADPQFRAYLMAYLFAAIIRIHFFTDGNGRVARACMALLSSVWHCPYVVIPKVRNDAGWRQALSEAINGDMSKLAYELDARMGV